MKTPKNKVPKTIEQQIKRRTIVSFAVFFLVGALIFFGWRHLYKGEVEIPKVTAGAKKPLRTILNANEALFAPFFSNYNLVKTYPKERAAKIVRVNGNIGLQSAFDSKNWSLKLVKSAGDTLMISLDDIRKLPKTEIIYDFKCIEGWSQVSHWGGVRFSDFMKHYNLTSEAANKYISLYTPDRKYYVGIDMLSAMHPQTLLCYEMNDEPLPMNQGYPLRLIIPVKYGIKSLKRIGTLSFSDTRPPDYWAEQGYDYYSGL